MTDDKIELRSEKVRTIIGEIPSRVVRYGIIVITIVISGLLAAAYFIPYPETIDAKIMIKNETQGTIAIPYKYINTVRKGMTVSIELEGFDRQKIQYRSRAKSALQMKEYQNFPVTILKLPILATQYQMLSFSSSYLMFQLPF